MTNNNTKSLKYGDYVEVLQPGEILKTLDSNGKLDGLPFMPEMIQYCGKKLKVSIKVEKTCVNCLTEIGERKGAIKEFILNDVFFERG